ncbi:MAG TPA: S1/P1 nuclease [Vicinamibacteria bacterium]|nr:S1/P1 nuclease [Vicinamibacteria bacterium]
MRRVKILLACFLTASSASAWDLFGHHVVCAIAWEEMDEPTRQGVIDVLLDAPKSSDIKSLLPPGSRPYAARSRELFLKTCAWADLVRDELLPERKELYDHPDWHYVNRFWTPQGAGFKLLPERGTLGKLVERLEVAARSAANGSRPASERAIDVAWILHLVGDVHQPLHSSGRVTERDPEGDRGGNDFKLDDLEAVNLHAFWDSILTRSRRKHHSESYFSWVTRVASELAEAHPRDRFGEEIGSKDFDEWSRAAAMLAMTEAYPSYLVRDSAPPREYQSRVFAVASRQGALAGYRLAELLEQIFREALTASGSSAAWACNGRGS